MKTLKCISFLLILLSIIAGCKKTEETVQPSLSINPAQKDIEANQGNFIIAISSTVKWTASSDKSWITLDPVSGTSDGTIQVDYLDNISASVRTATITFKGSNVADKILTVTQLGIMPILTVSPANLSVAADAGNAVVNITSNLSWNVTSNQTWCTLAQSSGIGNASLTLNYQPNTVQSQRTAIITFAANGVTNQTVQVTQAAFVPVLSVTPSNQTVYSPSGSAVFNITSNISWMADCAETWCTLANPGGTNNGTLTVIYDENTTSGPRTATINVTGEGIANQSVTLTQTNLIPTLSLTPSNRDVTSATGSTTFEIASNTSWTAESNQTWCVIQNTTGAGNGPLNVSFEENTSNDQRVATITLSANGVATQTATVTQQSAIPTVGLVAWYPFNGNANDESGNGNNCTVNGAILSPDRKGITNQAYSFNGNSSYIIANNTNVGNFSGNTTFCFWINCSTDATGMVMDKDNYDYYWFQIDNNGLAFTISFDWNYSSTTQIIPRSQLENQWNFVCVMIENFTYKVYANGVYVNSVDIPQNAIINSQNLTFGRSSYWGHTYYTGKTDDIRIYNRALTEQEIQQLYNE